MLIDSNACIMSKCYKLFLAGCSVSDYIVPEIDQVYGKILADQLNYEYIHEAANGASNWRIWRKITEYLMTGNLTPDDILIVQYTEITRDEFCTVIPYPPQPVPKSKGELLHEPFNNSTIIRFKVGTSQWQVVPEIRELFKAYEKYFVDVEFDLQRFKQQNFMFQSMLLQHNITKVVFINTHRFNSRLFDTDIILPQYKPFVFIDKFISTQYDLTPTDGVHMNQAGQNDMACRLHKHLITLGLV